MYIFQKTELSNKNDTQGYIFGNITSAKDGTWVVTPPPPARRLVKREKGNDADLLTKKLSSTLKPSTVPIAKPSSIIISSSSTSSSKNSATLSTKKPENLLNISQNSILSYSSTSPKPSSTKGESKRPSGGSSSTTTTTTKKTVPTTTEPIKVFPATLVVLDRGYFVDFYRNRNNPDRDEACRLMFEHISHVAYDSRCYKDGTERFLKRIPCPRGELCADDKSNTSYVVKDHQFTYAISDPNQPK